MRVDAWKNQGAKVFANCKAIVANSIFFSKLATMANGSWSPVYVLYDGKIYILIPDSGTFATFPAHLQL